MANAVMKTDIPLEVMLADLEKAALKWQAEEIGKGMVTAMKKNADQGLNPGNKPPEAGRDGHGR